MCLQRDGSRYVHSSCIWSSRKLETNQMSIARRVDRHIVMHNGIAEQCRKSKMIHSLPALTSLRNRLRKKKKKARHRALHTLHLYRGWDQEKVTYGLRIQSSGCLHLRGEVGKGSKGIYRTVEMFSVLIGAVVTPRKPLSNYRIFVELHIQDLCTLLYINGISLSIFI